jgi:hypothetical protein
MANTRAEPDPDPEGGPARPEGAPLSQFRAAGTSPESDAGSGPTLTANVPTRRKRGRPRKNPEPTSPSLNKDEPHSICSAPDDGKLMIQCDACDAWFHGKCVG